MKLSKIGKVVAAIFGTKTNGFVRPNPARTEARDTAAAVAAIGAADPVYFVAHDTTEGGRNIINARLEGGKTYTDPEAAHTACAELRKTYPGAKVVQSVDLCPEHDPRKPTYGANAAGEGTITYTESQVREMLYGSGDEAPKLETQADGRVFAIGMIEAAEEAKDEANIEAICPPDDDEPAIYNRTGPQWDGVYKALRTIQTEGTEEAYKGFCAVLTDHLALPGSMAHDHQEREDEGRAQDFSQRGDAIPLPGGAAKIKAKRQEIAERKELVDRMENECAQHFFALFEIAARYGKNPQSPYQRSHIVGALAGNVCNVLDKLYDAMPEREKRARRLVQEAQRQLGAAIDFTADLAGPDAERKDENIRLPKIDQGRILGLFILAAARAMEEAGTFYSKRSGPEIGLGETEIEGYR